jgi:hypothetical protein
MYRPTRASRPCHYPVRPMLQERLEGLIELDRDKGNPYAKKARNA